MTDLMTGPVTPYHSAVPTGRDGFVQVVRSEWTKFRTVRGWLVFTVVAGLAIVGLGLLTSAGSHSSYDTGSGTPDVVGHPYVPLGPDGEAVNDRFYFAHRPLTGDGTITARVNSFEAVPDNQPITSLTPWAKGGLIIKADTRQGSTYAAIMVTGGHGVRMQYNFTGDIAGPQGTVSPTSPRWLRLSRTGDTIAGAASTDGVTWTTVGTVRLGGLPSIAQAGLFVAAPLPETVSQHLGGGGKVTGSPAVATVTFDSVDRRGAWGTAAGWEGTTIGDPGAFGVQQSGASVVVTGAGDIAPQVNGVGTAIERVLVGAFAALTVGAVLAVLFVTTEYRRDLIRSTLVASPRRGRILVAKALVIGVVTFVTSLIACVVTLPLSLRVLRANGNFVYPVSWLTEVRVVAGTAAVMAISAVLALAIGAILRRSAGAVAVVVVLVVLPYILSTAGVLSPGPSEWLLRITPAAAFAMQQSMPSYHQVSTSLTPAFGFFPLTAWEGFAVLCGYTAVALGLAGYLLRRRDV